MNAFKHRMSSTLGNNHLHWEFSVAGYQNDLSHQISRNEPLELLSMDVLHTVETIFTQRDASSKLWDPTKL
jgi:hypothetical protein